MRRLAYALHLRGLALLGRQDPVAALGPLGESLGLSRATGDRWGIAYMAQGLAAALCWPAIPAARALCNEGLGLFRELDDPGGRPISLYSWA